MGDLVPRHEDEVNGRRVMSCKARGGRVEALRELFPFWTDGSQSLLTADLDSAAGAQAIILTKPGVGRCPL